MKLTKCAIEKLGFSKYRKEDSLEIIFSILNLYSLKGIKIEKECEIPNSKVVQFGKNCTVTISNSINEACNY